MEIRPFEESDEKAVIELWSNIFPCDAPHHNPKQSILRKLAVNRELFFVAVNDSLVVGTVMGGYDGHRGWIYSWAVDPAHRHQGTGQALVHHLDKELKKKNCPKVNLQILSSNREVIDFYEKLGYRVEERISMGKKLY